ncbi:PH domain-containing protein [Streptomyces sp. MS06]|uniref:PH domain-containing protein n=1 Tax=Streptomyces sp. MS06 TaxID=3385974 RepID=UPI0039A21926
MSTPEQPPSAAPQPPLPAARDRVYRSPAGIAGGVLLLALICWLGIDAIVVGHGSTPWLSLAGLLVAVPTVTTYTLRPAVFANQDRLRVRNPLRVVVLPWGEVERLRSGYSNEVVAKSGKKFQLWAVPVSLRARKKAARQQARAETAARRGSRGGGRGGMFGATAGGAVAGGPEPESDGPVRAETDKIMDELKEMLDARGPAKTSQGEVTVRWAYEVVAPVAAGLVLLAILLAVG